MINTTHSTSTTTGTATAGSRHIRTRSNVHAQPVDVTTDEGLRACLTGLEAAGRFTGAPEWELIGAQVLALAERDSWRWRRDADEYRSAYVSAAIELLRHRPATVLAARSPWGLLVAKARYAGQRAAGAQAACGLSGRDPVLHHVRYADAPRVVSLDTITERATLAAAS